MKDLFGSSLTQQEKEDLQRQMEKTGSAERMSREMADRFNPSMTRNEIKSMKRESRKGKR